MNTLNVQKQDGVLQVRLNRPSVRNAFNEELIHELTDVFLHLEDDVRVAVLSGEGAAFCAGADLDWMKRSKDYSFAENEADAARLEAMLSALDKAACPIVAKVHGAALGGGAGLIACCDIVVADQSAKLGFTEVRLGLVPAVISPFVLRKIGESAARRYFLTGEIFTAQTAQRIGLVHDITASDELDSVVNGIVAALAKNGPKAVRLAKTLIPEVLLRGEAARDFTIDTIAKVRVEPEAQEGVGAFLAKRDPQWP